MSDQDYKMRQAAKAIDILALIYASTAKGKRSTGVAVNAAMAVSHIHESMGDGITEYLSPIAIKQFYPSLKKTEVSDGDKYPWGDLQKEGDRFTYHPKIDEGETSSKVRFSIAICANRIFGAGVISTRIVPSGAILVIRKK